MERGHSEYLSGEGLIASYNSSERVNRYSCRGCGAPLPVVEDWDSIVGVPLGLLEEGPQRKTDTHTFVGSKAPWHEHTHAATSHDAWPPDEDMAERYRRLTQAS